MESGVQEVSVQSYDRKAQIIEVAQQAINAQRSADKKRTEQEEEENLPSYWRDPVSTKARAMFKKRL